MQRRIVVPIVAGAMALGLLVLGAVPAGAATGGGTPYRPRPVAGARPTTVVPISPSGCYQRVDSPHRSSHLGWIAGELTTQCNLAIPEISQTSQLWEERWWGWDRVGAKGAETGFGKKYVRSWANVTCRKSTLRTTGSGFVVDIDGDRYYASTNSGPVTNPCHL